MLSHHLAPTFPPMLSTPHDGKTPLSTLLFPTTLPYKTVLLRKGSPCTTKIDKQFMIYGVYQKSRMTKCPIVEPLLSATSALSGLPPHYPPSVLRHFALLEKSFAPLSQFYE